MKKSLDIALILVLFVILAGVRFFETQLFYDPLLSFFKGEYQSGNLPDLNSVKLLLNVALRFWLNTLISLAILWFAFRDKSILSFSFYIYLLLFVVLFLWILLLVLNLSESSNFQLLFYVRRFLIQPVFVLLLLPAFYYHKQKIK